MSLPNITNLVTHPTSLSLPNSLSLLSLMLRSYRGMCDSPQSLGAWQGICSPSQRVFTVSKSIFFITTAVADAIIKTIYQLYKSSDSPFDTLNMHASNNDSHQPNDTNLINIDYNSTNYSSHSRCLNVRPSPLSLVLNLRRKFNSLDFSPIHIHPP